VTLAAVTPELLFSNLVNAWLYGSLLAAVAVALTLVFGLGRVVNFAIGSFYAVGAYLAFEFRAPLGFWVAIALAAVCVALLGGIVERIAIRPLHSRGEIDTVLATFGIAIMFDGLIQLVWGTSTRTADAPIGGAITLFSQRISVFLIVAAGLAMVLYAGVWQLLRTTSLGTTLRGSSQNSSMAELVGINTNKMMTGLFAASAGIAALIGGFAGPLYSVRPGMGIDFLLDAFLAVVIGGLGSVRGAIVGAYIVAVTKNLSLSFITGDIATAVSFAIVICILLFRPTGIFREGRAVG
jgi:branched-chain amino acid transport system permease protein